jgi:hypothetical protein
MRTAMRITVATVFWVAAIMSGPPHAAAQTAPQQPQPAAPDTPAPVKPYQAVAIILPVPVKDGALESFRQQLTAAARQRDRAALSRLVVSKGFFWDRDNGDGANKRKSGFDNLAMALALNNRDAAGWDMIASFADDPAVAPGSGHANAMCAPPEPVFDPKSFQRLLAATQTSHDEWGYPVEEGIEVRAGPQSSAPVVDKLGLHLIWVLPDDSPAAAVTSSLRVTTPSGKIGYIPADAVAPLGNDQICYVKDGKDWKVGGYIGAGDPQ